MKLIFEDVQGHPLGEYYLRPDSGAASALGEEYARLFSAEIQGQEQRRLLIGEDIAVGVRYETEFAGKTRGVVIFEKYETPLEIRELLATRLQKKDKNITPNDANRGTG